MNISKGIKRNILIIISFLFGLLILLEHHYVFIVFDDYGYASLSYGWTENSAGMAYTMKDIWKFLSWHYFNWGGRVLCFFFEIIVCRLGGVELIQVVQAIIIISIYVLSGKIISRVTHCDYWGCIAISLVLYGTFDLITLRESVFWYSASVAYVWPLLPLLGSIYLYLLLQENETRFRKCTVVFLAFLAGFSQEQIAVLTVVWIICIMLLDYVWEGIKNNQKKKIPNYIWGMCGSAILGGMLTIMAPGNFIRSGREEYAEFYSKTILSRLLYNIDRIIKINIGYDNWLFVLIVTIFCGLAVSIYLHKKKICIMSLVYVMYYIYEHLTTVPYAIGIVVRGVWTVNFLILLCTYYYKRRNFLFISMLVAGICSQGAMIVTPGIPIRCHTMMEFVLHIIVAECIINIYMSEIYRTKNVLRIVAGGCVFALCLFSLCNLGGIISKCKQNDGINKINHYKLKEAGERYKYGHELKEIHLYKLYDDNYTNCMPYQPEHNFIEEWMKNYYELPQDVSFFWHSIEDDLNKLEWYVKSGDYWDDNWLGKEAIFVVQAFEEGKLNIRIDNSTGMGEQQIICTIAGDQTIYIIQKGEISTAEINIPQGENELKIQATQTFVPDNGDPRELSVLLYVE